MNSNNSRVAIVTGASRGIGAAVAERLALELRWRGIRDDFRTALLASAA